jgi:large subunit ribosomal protein L3
MKFILATKKEMTQIFNEEGNVVPVTIVKAGPCPIIRLKKKEDKDGYSAVVIGLAGKKKLGKRELGQLKGLGNLAHIKEFRVDDSGSLKSGDIISVATFNLGEKIKVTGTSKGKGFQGVVKRHGFHGHSQTHGTKDAVRAPGSIGAGGVQRVFPGIRMAGHMGDEQITVKNLKIAKIDSENNELYIKGALPGTRGSLLIIKADGELKVNQANPSNVAGEQEKINEPTVEPTVELKTEPANSAA